VNHTFFWESMSPNGGGKPSGKVAEAIEKDLGGYDKFVEAFKAAGGCHASVAALPWRLCRGSFAVAAWPWQLGCGGLLLQRAVAAVGRLRGLAWACLASSLTLPAF